MLQEPNAPPCYPLLPSLPFRLLILSSTFRANPFSASFPLRLPSFFYFAEWHVPPLLLFSLPLTHLLHPLTNPPRKLPATSREFYKTFHASLTASASFSQTKQRILVWIEFLMEPTPPGPRPIPFNLPIHLYPSRLRCSAILVHLVRTA